MIFLKIFSLLLIWFLLSIFLQFFDLVFFCGIPYILCLAFFFFQFLKTVLFSHFLPLFVLSQIFLKGFILFLCQGFCHSHEGSFKVLSCAEGYVGILRARWGTVVGWAVVEACCPGCYQLRFYSGIWVWEGRILGANIWTFLVRRFVLWCDTPLPPSS